MITAVTIWLVWHKFFPKICNTDHPKTARKAKKRKKERMVLKGRAEASLWGFFNGPNFLLQEVPSWKWYRRAEVLFFSFFFFKNRALGKLQKLNRKYEIWKFKKGTKSLQSGHGEAENIGSLVICPKPHLVHSFFPIHLRIKKVYQLLSQSLSHKFFFCTMRIILVIYY